MEVPIELKQQASNTLLNYLGERQSPLPQGKGLEQ